MRASTKRILSILLSGIFLISVIAVVTSLIGPEVEDIGKKRSLLFSKESLFASQNEAITQVQNIIQEFKEFARLKETVDLAMPLDENTTQILNQIDAITRTTGVNIKSFESALKAFEKSNKPLTERLGSLDINLLAEGRYANIKNFLKLLEANVRVFNVRQLVFSPLSGGSVGNWYRVLLTVDTYFQE